jgi:DNA-nicking Smr family endonuclease
MKQRRVPPVDAEARALFRSAVADAIPLSHDRVVHEPAPPRPIPRQYQLDEQSALQESLYGPPLLDLHLEGGDEAAWLRPGLARSILKDLRRGRWVVQDHLDLHGANRDKARQLFSDFLTGAMARGLRCLRIVHGKGLGSPGREPVLKKLVLGWLSQRNEVLAFCQARAAEGGAGAVVILLKSPK